MFYLTALASAVTFACLFLPSAAFNETTSNNSSFTDVLATAMNTHGNYSDYLSLLKQKCESHYHHLTSYEQQCCMKISHASAHLPFSIIKQDTNIMQFTNDIDPSLFKILLNHFSNGGGSHSDVSDTSTIDGSSITVSGGHDLEQCLSEKTACLHDLSKSSALAQQHADELNNVKELLALRSAAALEHENEIQRLKQQHDVDQQEIQKLTALLESTTQHLLAEEEKTSNLLSDNEKCRADLGIVEHHLSQCQSSLHQTKQDLVQEISNLTKCTAQLADAQADQAAITAMEGQLTLLRTENAHLRDHLVQCLKAGEEKDAELDKCAQLEPQLILCEQRLGHCHNTSSETVEHWQDEHDQCTAQLNSTVNHLNKITEATVVLQSELFEVKKTVISCNENYTIQKNENELLLTKNNNLVEQLTAMGLNIQSQSMHIISLEEQLENCMNDKERAETSLLSYKNDLSLQLETYTRLQLRYYEQTNKTMVETKAREICQANLAEVEGDSRVCHSSLEEARADLHNRTITAEQCAADHNDCIFKLGVATSQLQNCSSSAELASWQALHDQCSAEKMECERSRSQLASQLQVAKEEFDGCHASLDIAHEQTTQCQTANSNLLTQYTFISETHTETVNKLQLLSAKETACQLELSGAREEAALCLDTAAQHQSAHDLCLTELQRQAEWVGVLEETTAEQNASLAHLSNRYDLCDQERHAAITSASRLNVTVHSLRMIMQELADDIIDLEKDLDSCLHSRNLTSANVTEWQQRHERCQLSIQESEQQHLQLAQECDAVRLDNADLELRLSDCQGQLTELQLQRQTLLIEVQTWRLSTSLYNQTAADCAARLQLKTAEALHYQTSELATSRLLQECTAALHACQNPPLQPCPPTHGNNTFYGVDLTEGHGGVTYAEELIGCYMPTYDRAQGSAMKHFCHTQQAHLFKVTDARSMEFVHHVVDTHQGKYLVEPSAYYASSLGLNLHQYAADEDVCYYVERTTNGTSPLKHDRCDGHVFHSICWTGYQSGYNYTHAVSAADSDRVPDYLDYAEVPDESSG